MSKDWFYHIKTMKIEETEIVSANCTNKIKQDVNLVFIEKINLFFLFQLQRTSLDRADAFAQNQNITCDSALCFFRWDCG